METEEGRGLPSSNAVVLISPSSFNLEIDFESIELLGKDFQVSNLAWSWTFLIDILTVVCCVPKIAEPLPFPLRATSQLLHVTQGRTC